MSGNGSQLEFNPTHSFFDTSTSFVQNNTCVKDSGISKLIELILSSALLPVHVFVIVAMLLFKDIVKRNSVNVYAANVIVANIIMNTWRIFVNGQYYANDDPPSWHRSFDEDGNTTYHVMDTPQITWWTFKKTVAVLMLLVISGSIGLVINALRNSMFRVHRTVAGFTRRESINTMNSKNRNTSKNRIIRRRLVRLERMHPTLYATGMIAPVWAVPLILIFPPIFLTSCKLDCHCLYDFVPSDSSIVNCPKISNCSNFMLPISQLTVQFGFALWATYVVLLGIFLLKATRDLRQIINQRIIEGSRKQSNANQLRFMRNGTRPRDLDLENWKSETESEVKSSDTNGNKKEQKENNSIDSTSDETLKQADTKIETNPQIMNRRNTAPPGSLLLEGGRKSFRLLLLMFAAYVIGTAPFAIFSLYDSLQGTSLVHLEEYKLIIIRSLPILAEAFCTVMLCVYLPGIKSATQSSLLAIGGRCR